MGALLLDWATAAGAGPRVAGGKGWNLGRLAVYGFPVPPGGVLAAAGYRLLLETNGLAAAAAALDADAADPSGRELTQRLEAFRERLAEAPVPEALVEALESLLAWPELAGRSLAVRSSATAEDGAAASFAGIHHTSLNVPPRRDEVAAAVKRCYASLWTPHALAYRRRRAAGPVEMAVVLMALVPARAAGVAFSADSRSGRRDRIVVTANFGLGESVVAGAADADEFHVQRSLAELPYVVFRRIGRKERQTVVAESPGGGTRMVEGAFGADGGRRTADGGRTSPPGPAAHGPGGLPGPRDTERGNEGGRIVAEAPLRAGEGRRGPDGGPLGGRPGCAGVRSASGSTAALEDEQVLRLATLVMRCQDALGEDDWPQDVEWAYEDGSGGAGGGSETGGSGGAGRFWLLQARPITALPDPAVPGLEGQPAIWSTANVKEVLPPALTPYGWSTLGLALNLVMEALVGSSGYPLPQGLRWARLYHGHPYFNLSLIQWVMYDAFGTLPAQTNQLIGGKQPEIRVPRGWPFAGRRGLARLRRLVGQMLDARRAFGQIEAARKDLEAFARRQLGVDLSARSEAQLFADLREMGRRNTAFVPQFMRANSQASIWLDGLVRFLGWVLPGRGRALAARLLAATGGITSAEQGYRLVEVARLAAVDERARAFFLGAESLPSGADDRRPTTDDRSPGRRRSSRPLGPVVGPVTLGVGRPLATAWEEGLAGTAAGEAFRRFLEEFGHRGIDELEIANARWVEDPSYLVETVRQHILDGVDSAPARAAGTRAAAERELAQALRFHPARLCANWLLAQARRASVLRENTKSALVLTMLPMRRTAGELARRLLARGLLPSADDLYFLTAADVQALLDGLWDGTGVARLVADRRARYLRQLRERVPDVLLDERPLVHAAAAAEGAGAAGAGGGRDGQVFEGLGVAAGVARGPARVVLHPRAGGVLQQGEVLVAPTTDPGWTPLFLRAAALVVETGGYLSHGAIVAREYGIPAVANVPGVLDLVRDGDELVVDGDQGEVTRRAPMVPPSP